MTAGQPFWRTILAVCAAIIVVLWLAQANPYLNPADDSGRYMVLGESLAQTGDLRLINDVRHLRDTLYVPGFPLLIACWLKATGSAPGAVVLPVKATLLILQLGTLPLFLVLLQRARLRQTTIVCAMFAYALCPAMVAYSNEVMSEMLLLFLCLASIVLATRPLAPSSGARTQIPNLEGTDAAPRPAGDSPPAPNAAGAEEPPDPTPEPRPPTFSAPPAVYLAGALVCACLAYYVRAAGAILLLSLIVWFCYKRQWLWGTIGLVMALLVVGTWQLRTSRIIASDPPNTPHDTYMKQFTLKNPDDPNAGRIQMNALGIASRIKRCFPPNIGNIPRAVLFSMGAPKSIWQYLFFVVAVPFTLLALAGWALAWRKQLYLICGFSALFWVFIALWPWLNPRFLVPLIPYILLYVFIAAEALYDAVKPNMPDVAIRTIFGVYLALMFLYYARVYSVVIPREHRGALTGYSLGRTKDEAGFYAAANWLRGREPDTVVMARPTYLMHLYSGHPTTQIEPSMNAKAQELAYMLPNHVRYLVADKWSWSHTDRYVGNYLSIYGKEWTLVWTDPLGSGVTIYRRNL